MRDIYFVFFILLIASCSTSDNNDLEDACQLISYEPAQLYYEYFNREDLGFRVDNFDPDFNGIEIQYDNNDRIIKIIGGPTPFPMGSGLTGWLISDLTQYDIEYSENNISISSTIESFYGDTTNDYTIVNSRIAQRSIIIPQGLLNEKVNFTYQYQENKVLEFKGDDLHRTFYFENRNLIKIEKLIYHDINNPLEESDILHAKYETIFSEFDNLPNLLEGKFYIDGAFFKAFSKNNYHKIESKYYTYNQDTGSFEHNSNLVNWRSYNFGVNEDGSSGLFTIDCFVEN
jgi:hypothetical protein